MRLCLSCRRVSPGGSIFCGYCARSFGMRLCANKHKNAPHVLCCTTCASPDLTEATQFVPLGCLPIGLSLLCGLALWRWCLAHLCFLGTAAWVFALWLVSLLLGLSPCAINRLFWDGVRGLIMLWLLGTLLSLLPGQGGTADTWLRGLPSRAASLTFTGIRALLKTLGHVLRRAFWPVPSRTKPGSADKHD